MLPEKQPDTRGIHQKPKRSDDPKAPSAPSLVTESDDSDNQAKKEKAKQSKLAGEVPSKKSD